MDPHRLDAAAPEVRDRWREFQDNGNRARELAGRLDPEQMWWRTSPDRWSVGECLDHLVLAGDAYLEVIDEALTDVQDESPKRTGPPRRSLWGDVLVRGVEPPPRMKLPAPRRIRPQRPENAAERRARSGGKPDSPLRHFLTLRDRVADRLEIANGRDLGRIRIRSPFVPLVSVNLHSALRIMTGHERRHLHQAERVIHARDFPQAARGVG